MNYNICASTFPLYSFGGSDLATTPIFCYSVRETQIYGYPIISSFMNMNPFQYLKKGKNSEID